LFCRYWLQDAKRRPASCRFFHRVTSKPSERNFHHPQFHSNIAFLPLETEMTNPIYRNLKLPGKRARLASTVRNLRSGQSPWVSKRFPIFHYLLARPFVSHGHCQYNFNLHKFFWYLWSFEQFVHFQLNKIQNMCCIYTNRKIWRIKLLSNVHSFSISAILLRIQERRLSIFAYII